MWMQPDADGHSMLLELLEHDLNRIGFAIEAFPSVVVVEQ